MKLDDDPRGVRSRPRGDLVSSFDSAFRGLFYVLKVERNFRIHAVIGSCVILLSLFLNIPLGDFLILVLTVTLVIVAELVNTVVEMLIDSFIKEYRIKAKRIKDTAAAVVLVSAASSLVVGYLVVARYFPPGWRYAFENIAHSPWYITFIILTLVIITAVVLKFILKMDSLITGGMPSLHSAISFSIWMIVSFLTFSREPLISFLVLLLAFWVAQSRVQRKIHRIEEVVIGAVVGMLITTMVFQIFGW